MTCIESTRVESDQVSPENEQHCVQWQVMSCGQCRGEAPAFSARQLGSMAALVHNTTFRRWSHLDVSRQHSNDVFHAPNSRIVAALSKGNTSCCVDACKGAIHRTQQNKFELSSTRCTEY